LVEFSSFAEHAPPRINISRFSSIACKWHSSCTPGYRRNEFSNPATDDELIKRELPMLRIEKESNGHTTTLRLSGRIQSVNIGDIQVQMDDGHVRLFMDLGEVILVDVEVVRLLSECEDGGIVLVHCPTYVREWFFASEPKGHSRKFRMVCDSRRG
jgi:hypothetical protein